MRDDKATHKRMILAGAVVVAVLGVGLWRVTPPPDGDAPAPRERAPDAAAATPPLAADLGGECGACPEGQLCFTHAALPDGVCSRGCARSADCPAGWCCFDPMGAGEARFFVCAPPKVCAGRVTGTPE